MSQIASTRDIIVSSFRESKDLEKKGRLEDALSKIESLQDYSSNMHSSLREKIVERKAYLYTQLSKSSEDFAYYCRKAENLLKDWISFCKTNKVPVQERIIHLYTSALNSWAVYQQGLNNYQLALNYLMKAIQFLEKAPSHCIEIVEMIAKTRANISSLYVDLHRYEEAISQGEIALVYLQRESKARRLIGNEEKSNKNICTYLSVFYNIGLSQKALGDTQKMKETYRRAIEISSHVLPDDHPQIVKIWDVLQSYSNARNAKRSHFFSENIHEYLDKIPRVPSPEKSTSRQSIANKRTVSHANLADLKNYKPCNAIGQKENIQKLNLENKHSKFVSADQFFHAKIHKQLNLNKPVKNICHKNPQTIAKEDCDFKRKMNELRLRRHFKCHKYETKGLDYIKERIDLLKKEDDLSSKPIMRTKSLSKIEAPKTSDLQTFNHGNQHQQAKQEIEELMGNINAEIKGIHSKAKGHRKNRISLVAESTLTEASRTKKSLKLSLKRKYSNV